jgi:CRP/FNR family cyclic AMP-dependent transcriptional regulator
MKPLSLIEKAFFLKKVRIFSGLDFELLLAIAEKLHDDDYDAEEKVFMSGQVANRIYFIAEGMVQLLDDRMGLRATLKQTDFFGDESLFNDAPRTYCSLCKTDAILLTLSRSHLLSIISECPSVAVSLLQIYAHALPCRFLRTGVPVP